MQDMQDIESTLYKGVSYNACTVSPTVLFDIQLLFSLDDPLRAGLFFGRYLLDRFHIYF